MNSSVWEGEGMELLKMSDIIYVISTIGNYIRDAYGTCFLISTQQ